MLHLSTPLSSVSGCYLFSQVTRARQSNHLGPLRCLSSGLGLGHEGPSVSLQVTGRTRCSKAVHALYITSRVGIGAQQKQQLNQVTPSSPFSILPRIQVRHFTPSGRLCSSHDGEKWPQKSVPTQEDSKPASASARLVSVLSKTKNGATKHENINTIPNWLTFSRLVVAPFIGYCILHDHNSWALGLFAYAGITDLLDGWVARKWKLQTVVGTVIDPMADKTLMTILTVTLATKGLLPVWLAVIILGRDVALAVSAIYYRWISLPPPKTFTRYWDFSLPSAEIRPTSISKYNTALQLGLMGLTTLAPVIPAVDLVPLLVALQYVVATTTIWSGASYIYSKDAVKILSHNTAPTASFEQKQEQKAEQQREEEKPEEKKWTSP